MRNKIASIKLLVGILLILTVGVINGEPAKQKDIYYLEWVRQSPFDISSGDHECSYEYYYNGVMAKVKAWNGGNSTMYTPGLFVIKCLFLASEGQATRKVVKKSLSLSDNILDFVDFARYYLL